MALIIIGLLCKFLAASLHPFHVSVCEIYHNEKDKSLEISLKLFIDDFELSIQKSGNPAFKLMDTNPKQVDKKSIGIYLNDHFKIKVNSKPVQLSLLGFEFRDESILCYLEGTNIPAIQNLELVNSVVTEVYVDQINLSHLQINEKMKSLKTTRENTAAIVEFVDP